nr:hypothetical protein [Tanacetum cinerariifolium]
VHIAAGGFGRGFAVVKEVRLALHKQGHEPAAADVACFGVGHGQCERRRHCGIDGVAAFFQDLRGDVGAVLVRCCNGPTFQHDGVHRRTDGKDDRQGEGLECHDSHRASLMSGGDSFVRACCMEAV